MVVVGELEGLVSNHKLLISRGEISEAGKVKELIGGYLSKKDRIARLYKGIAEKLEEFVLCAEANFEKFQEIINYKMLTQLEYFYPEYFGELAENVGESAKKQMVSGSLTCWYVTESISAAWRPSPITRRSAGRRFSA